MAVLVVTSSKDITNASDGVLTLREAITQANASAGDDTITFAQAVRTIKLTQGELVIDNVAASDTGKLTIDGDFNNDKRADVVVSAGYGGRVIHIEGDQNNDNQSVLLDGLTIKMVL